MIIKFYSFIVAVFCTLTLVSGCSSGTGTNSQNATGSNTSGEATSPFTEEAVQRGLIYEIIDYPETDGHLGVGSAFGDLDNDGDQDVIMLDSPDGTVGVFENDGTGNFIDRSENSRIPKITEESGTLLFDYDADGLLDLYITQIGEGNLLLKNLGNFRFQNTTLSAGVQDFGSGESASAGDFDGDGYLDFYLSNYTGLTPKTLSKTSRTGDGTDFNVLFRNNGDGTFTDVSKEQGVDSNGYSFQSVWMDIDRDGDLDLYLSNDRPFFAPFQGNQLWENVDGQLVEISEQSGADVKLYSMGVAAGDFDGNGFPDMYCTNIDSYDEGYNYMLLNQGDNTFVQACEETGTCDYITSWGAIFFDFDNDTHLDLYVNNMFQPNALFECNGSFPCEEVAEKMNLTANEGTSFSASVADIDKDGDLDVLVNNPAGNVELFINHEGEKRNWIRFDIAGYEKNIFAVGANVEIQTGNDFQFREIYAGGNNYLGQNEFTIHFGLDQTEVVDFATVQWPGGETVRTLTNIPANTEWKIYPPEKLGDSDQNGTVGLDDFTDFISCFDSDFIPGCEVMDFNGNSEIDDGDFSSFVNSYDEALDDCDNNGVFDLRDIFLDSNKDSNANGVLDICE